MQPGGAALPGGGKIYKNLLRLEEYELSGGYRANFRAAEVESRASPPGWTLRLGSGQARETPVPPSYDSSCGRGN